MTSIAETAPRGERIFRNATRSWVGAPCTQQDATLAADVPAADDVRWHRGMPTVLDKRVLTLSPFAPSGRLGCCVEEKKSAPLFRHPNHPPFAGAVAWMDLDQLDWNPIH